MHRDIPEDRRNELAELLKQGQKIEAIKIYRELTGLGLKESKEDMEELEAAAKGNYDIPNSDWKGQIEELLFQGRKIQAIKLYRKSTGHDLKQSKESVEAMEASLREQQPGKFLPVTRHGCLGLLVVAFLCIVAAACGLAKVSIF